MGLYEHFENEGTASQMYLTSWLHTLFCLSGPSVSTRIWDNFLLNGFEILVRVSLGMLKLCEKKLLTMNTIEAVSFLKEPNLVNPQVLIDTSLDFNIPPEMKERFDDLN